MSELYAYLVIAALAVAALLIFALTYIGWTPPSQFGTPPLSIDKRAVKNIGMHAGMSAGIVFILFLLTHILPFISVTSPWGAVIAAILSALINWARKYLADNSGIVYPTS